MDLKQRNTRFLFPVFVIFFLIIFILGSNFSGSKSYNFMNSVTIKNRIASDDVVLIVIDDKSLDEIGRWPWKREYYLDFFDFIEKSDAKSMGYDGIVVAPDSEYPESDKKFFNNIKKFDKLSVGFAFSSKDFESNIDKDEYNNLLSKYNIKVTDKRNKKTTNPDNYIFKSFSALQMNYFKNIKSLGFISVPEDDDGYIRRTYQLIKYNDNFYPSLGLTMFLKYANIKELILTDKYLLGYSNEKQKLKIPVEYSNENILNYICYYNSRDGVYAHKIYSASDIIKSYRAIKKGQKPIVDPSEFKDKFVIVGANAQAMALKDILRTPVYEGFSGADIQATNLDNLLNNNFFKPTGILFNLFTCILISLITFYIVTYLPIVFALISCMMLGLLYFGYTYFMYINQIAIDLFLPEFFILVVLGFAYSYKYFVEDSKKTKIQRAMGKYLSNEVMQNVVKNIDNIELGGKRADITVLFADIRNFTTISENMDAASTSMILNEYFSAMVPIIEEHNGVLNKFMGDAVLAIFGEPKKSNNHALDAVRCGYKMLKKVKQLQEKWLDEGKPKIEIGIGISSGDAFVGNIGSSERLEYTVIGDTVNTASRIENYNKIYRTNFLISEETYKRTKNSIDVITIKDVVIRGKANKVNLYEVIRLID